MPRREPTAKDVEGKLRKARGRNNRASLNYAEAALLQRVEELISQGHIAEAWRDLILLELSYIARSKG